MPGLGSGRRRRMDKFSLGEISFVDQPAQEGALANIEKARKATLQDLLKQRKPYRRGESRKQDEDFDAFARQMRRRNPGMTDAAIRTAFESEMSKAGDMVDLLTSSDEGHQHGVKVYRDEYGGLMVMIAFASGPDGEMHDHQVVMDETMQYMVSENHGHTHEIDQERMRMLVFEVMTKRAASDDERERLAKTGMSLPDGRFPIPERADLAHAIVAFEHAKPADQSEIARHIAKRAGNLDALNMLPREGVLADLLKSEDDTSGQAVKKETRMTDDLKKAMERIEALEATNALLVKVAALPAAEKAHYDGLDEDAREHFMGLDDAHRAQTVADAQKAKADADPVVYKADDGSEYRKSDDPRLVAMAKSRDEDRKEHIRLRKAQEDADLTKRADTDLKNLPGDLAVRKALLKAVDGIEDETVRQGAHDALKAHNARMGGALREVGFGGAPAVIEKGNEAAHANAELERLAKERAAKEDEDFYIAYDKVSEQNPDLLYKAVNG